MPDDPAVRNARMFGFVKVQDLLSFNYNKKKEVGVREIRIGDKTLIEAVV